MLEFRQKIKSANINIFKELKEAMSKDLKESLRTIFHQRDKESLRTMFHERDNIKS